MIVWKLEEIQQKRQTLMEGSNSLSFETRSEQMKRRSKDDLDTARCFETK